MDATCHPRNTPFHDTVDGRVASTLDQTHTAVIPRISSTSRSDPNPTMEYQRSGGVSTAPPGTVRWCCHSTRPDGAHLSSVPPGRDACSVSHRRFRPTFAGTPIDARGVSHRRGLAGILPEVLTIGSKTRAHSGQLNPHMTAGGRCHNQRTTGIQLRSVGHHEGEDRAGPP